MIETPDAVDVADKIIGVDGIDAIRIGSNDLTTAMRIPGQYGHERVREAYRIVIDACRAAGKPLIIGGIRKKEQLEPYVGMGAARCYFAGADTVSCWKGPRASSRKPRRPTPRSAPDR